MLVLINSARSLVKRGLSRVPFAFRMSKRAYMRYKAWADKRSFLARHPSAQHINFRPDELSDIRRQGFHSQYGQDLYLWEHVFNRRPTGFFLDIGGNDPVRNNNSYYLEKRGWTGLAFDPMSRFRLRWLSERSAKFHQVAIANRVEERDFTEFSPREGWEHALSGFSELVRREDKAIYDSKSYKVRTAPVGDFLDEGQHVDLIMIDVEGAEPMVLEGIDFEKIRPDYLLIENVSQLGGSEDIRSYVGNKGYEIIARIGLADDVFRRVAPKVR